MVTTDRVEHTISLCAFQDRVWLALTDAEQLAYWFGATFDAGVAFVEGARVDGRIAPTNVDPQIARTQRAHFGMPLVFTVERVEGMGRLSFRWHSFAWEAPIADADEPETLVVFELEEVASRTNLTITESGFARLPEERRAVAHAASTKGWARQSYLLEKFLAGARDLRRVRD